MALGSPILLFTNIFLLWLDSVHSEHNFKMMIESLKQR